VTTDVVVRYEPRGAARDLFGARQSEVAMAGPAGTGKSLACLFRVHLAALNNPEIRCLIVRKTAVSLGSTTLVSFEKKVAADAIRTGVVKWFGGSTREAACYRYSNGSVIVVGGLDKPEKVLSSEYDLVFADEATELTETDWEVLGTRLRNGRLPWQQQIAACNPAQPTHWIKQRSDRGTMRMLTSRHRDNPAYINADGTLTEQGVDYLGKLDNLTGVRRLRLRDGQWAAAEGLIYEGWDESVHLVDRFDIPDTWARWWAIDFGFTNPFVCQFWAEDPDGRLYLYREIYMSQRTVDQHAATIARVVLEGAEKAPGTAWTGTWTEPRPRAIVCDHDAEGRVILQRELGLPTVAANKKVSEGIQAVQKRLRNAEDGRPRLFIMRNSLVERDETLADLKKPTNTEEEIVGYIWDRAAGDKIKEVPRKEDDHGMDPMRYLVAARDLAGRPNVRWI
jgi:PBSX family phage terminase large subunit